MNSVLRTNSEIERSEAYDTHGRVLATGITAGKKLGQSSPSSPTHGPQSSVVHRVSRDGQGKKPGVKRAETMSKTAVREISFLT